MSDVDRASILRRHVRGIDDVLDSDGHSVQRPEWIAVDFAGLSECDLLIEELPSLNARFAIGDPMKAGTRQLLGGDLAARKQRRRLACAELGELPHG